MKTRIYIVEDEALIAMELSDRLTKLGYEISGKAARGEQALEEIPRVHPDIVLMDIRLAGTLTGIETAAQLRWHTNVPIVFLSAFSDPAVLTEALDTEPFGYLVKPFEERELHATLQAALYKHRMTAQHTLTRTLENQLHIAGSIAHTFNNLLQTIVGHLTLAQTSLSPENRHIAGNLDQAAQAARIATDITGALLLYTGKSHAEHKLTSLNEIVRTYSSAPPSSRRLTKQLQLHLSDRPLSILANDKQVAHLLDQLIANSVEAIGSGPGAIRLSTGVMTCDEELLSLSHVEGTLRPGSYTYLEVADDGCGMDTETLQRAFDLFFTTKFLGRGLGLPAVRGIVQSHRGGLLATSGPGKGTTIRVLFPFTSTPHAAVTTTTAHSSANATPSRNTILVVDDAAMIRILSQEGLEGAGYQVLTAGTGTEALTIFTQRHQDIGCVLLDLSMPGMDGLQIYDALQQIQPNTKVLLISGYQPDTLRQRYQDKGFNGFLKKPFQLSVLREAVEKLLKNEHD